MGIWSKIFGSGNGQSLTLVPAGSQNQNNQTTWMGIPIKNRVEYRYNVALSKSRYVGADCLEYSQYKGDLRWRDANRDYKEYDGGVVIGNYIHKLVDAISKAQKFGSAADLFSGLKEQSKGKSLSDIRPSGVAELDYASYKIGLAVLDLAALREVVDQRRDQEIFRKIETREERELFTFRQTSSTALLTDQSRDNRPLMIVESYDLNGKDDFKCNHRFSSLNDLIQKLAVSSKLYDDLFNGRYKFCVGIAEEAASLQSLPSEMMHNLKRQIVLSKLEGGLQDRLLSVERALLADIRRNIIKLTFHNGADETHDTAKSIYLWLTIKNETITGTIKEGEYKGRSLSSMRPEELTEFYKECRNDTDSLALCEAYFRHIDFEGFRQKKEWARPRNENSDMTLEEACEILGLDVPKNNKVITPEDIKSAFKRAARESGHDTGTANQSQDQIDAGKVKIQKVLEARNFLENRFGA